MPTLLFSLLLALAGPSPSPATTYASKSGGFKVDFPVPPIEQGQTVESPAGPVESRFFLADYGNLTEVVAYTDYPAAMAVGGAGPKLLEGAAKAAVSGMRGAKLLGSSDWSAGAATGKDLEFSFPGGDGQEGRGRVRLVLVGARIYSATLVGPKDQVARSAAAFLRSFVLNPPESVKAGASASASTAVAPYASPGGFHLAIPGTPREQASEMTTPAGPIAVRVVSSEVGRLRYSASYLDIPRPGGNGQAPDEALDAVVRGSVDDAHGTLVSRRPHAYMNIPGRDFEYLVTPPGGSTLLARSRAYLAGGRLYQVQVVGPKDEASSPAADAFLRSFAPTDRAAR